MTEPLLIAFSVTGLIIVGIFILLAVVFIRVNSLIKTNSESGSQELIRLQQLHEVSLKEGFSESRKELREVSSENRRETQDAFKNFQDTMLNRISENGTAQHKQLEMFKNALNELSERLITNSNEFKQSVSSSFQSSSEALNRKQDEFREHIIVKFDAFDTSMKDDAKTNRQELTEGLNALNALFEKIIINSNDFKESVTQSFQSSSTTLNQKQDEFREKTALKLDGFDASIKNDAKLNRQELNDGLKSFGAKFSENITEFNNQLSLKFSDLNKQQVDATAQAKGSIVEIRDAIEKQLKSIREDNTQQLTEIRKTVDEKLQSTLEKRLGESFKQVSDRLEQVHKGLGEMQTLAIGVGDLKKVLSNVKTRGILGEYQLGNILEQVLTPEQYSTNVATKQGSQANVEFAVKLPGKADEKTVWLPMDSKFPLESYQLLLVAYDEAEPAKIDQAQKTLLKVVESFAKDISAKYIDPPYTTDFAIMFLPIESLFAEVLRHPHMLELLQRKYRITITGPTTLSALLNSLHMGFRTLAVQKRSSEVWKVLAEVKTEFASYSDQLALVHKQLTTASGSLEKLKDTRTKAMQRKLRDVAVLEITEDKEAVLLLEN
ncbi:DNA recombination protein RmuC [Methylobacter sp. G7]|uniref:DNA recombination protein RmuC n=1 Tax=Methylobacter sp. G7 TaxID=3230117 RepID=UPI003D808AE0